MLARLEPAAGAADRSQGGDDGSCWQPCGKRGGMLRGLPPSPVVTLNHAVAVAMAEGPAAGLDMLGPLLQDRQMRRHHRLHAVRAHLLEMDGRVEEARAAYAIAARLTTSIPEQRYLNTKAAPREPVGPASVPIPGYHPR